jgi:hypothetical protein
MRQLKCAALFLCLAATGCMHLKGVVLEDLPGTGGTRPMRSAALSIGRPNGLAVYGTYHVDDQGRFDFFIGPTDYNEIFLYDAAADPELTMHRLDQSQLNDHMVLHLRRAATGNPALPADVNINPF